MPGPVKSLAVFGSKEKAEEALELFEKIVLEFGQLSVADVYSYTQVTGSYHDEKWGWTDLKETVISEIDGHFSIDFPNPKPVE